MAITLHSHARAGRQRATLLQRSSHACTSHVHIAAHDATQRQSKPRNARQGRGGRWPAPQCARRPCHPRRTGTGAAHVHRVMQGMGTTVSKAACQSACLPACLACRPRLPMRRGGNQLAGEFTSTQNKGGRAQEAQWSTSKVHSIPATTRNRQQHNEGSAKSPTHLYDAANGRTYSAIVADDQILHGLDQAALDVAYALCCGWLEHMGCCQARWASRRAGHLCPVLRGIWVLQLRMNQRSCRLCG
jgi:hypothetical protein